MRSLKPEFTPHANKRRDWMTTSLLKPILLATVAVCVALPRAHAEDTFGIEDENLRPVPAPVAAVLRTYLKNTDYEECATGKFKGVPVDLAGRGQESDWIAMTADGCAWGAATAKIWVLKRTKTAYRLVLDDAGQDVLLLKSKTNGHRDLRTASGTAGHYSEAVLRYDGQRYKLFKSCAIDLNDPMVDKLHPDGQCHVNY